MKVTTSWQQGLTFTGQNEAGQQITIDGEGKAPSPMHLMLMAVGGLLINRCGHHFAKIASGNF